LRYRSALATPFPGPIGTRGDYGDGMPTLDPTPLRRCVLAVSVLKDLDFAPDDAGVRLDGPHGSLVTWEQIARTIGPFPAEGPVARRRVEVLLRLFQIVDDLGPAAAQHLHAAARVVALPAGHAEHPGRDWVREPLRGNALELGIGVHGLLGQPDLTVPVPPAVLAAIGVEPGVWWPRLREHAERMGALSAARLTRDGRQGLIRPVGGCDVLALLSSRTLRRHLAEGDGTGLRALAVPTRRRGWYDVRRVDPAFVQCAWALTDETDRGVRVPLLVTADDVALPFSLA
jgi:hypothetical protein